MSRPLVAIFSLTLLAASAAAQIPVPFGRAGRAPASPTVDQAAADQKALDAAGLKKDDAAGLTGYFRSRTLTDSELARMRAVIKRMGDEQFTERRAASDEAAKFGPAGIVPLRTASQTDPDPEIAFRAGEALKKIETVPHAQVASAAARRLTELAPPDAAAALLGFVPTADSAQVEEDIRAALAALVGRGNEVDPAILSALTDASPARRAAAAVALVTAGVQKPTGPAAAARPRVRAALAAEKEPDARYRMAFALAGDGRDPDALPALIDILPTLAGQKGRLWVVEDLLLQAAGADRPKTPLGPDQAGLLRAREAWKAWYDAHKSPDLLKTAYRPRTTGRLMLLSMNQIQWGNGRLLRLGVDGKPEWRVNQVSSPADLHVTDAGRVWLLEMNQNQLREWDDRGNQVQLFNQLNGQPVGFQPLPNGRVLIAYPHMVAEYDDKWKELRKFTRGTNDIKAVAQLPGGPVYVLAGNQQTSTILRLEWNEEKKEWTKLEREQKTGQPASQQRLVLIDRDRVLMPERSRVVEYDFTKAEQKPGEGSWTLAVTDPLSVQRLPNGNTLVADPNTLREYSPDKEIVWTYTSTDGQKITRALLR